MAENCAEFVCFSLVMKSRRHRRATHAQTALFSVSLVLHSFTSSTRYLYLR